MEILMKHFPVEEWIDFVRQVIRRTKRKERMKEHLEQGCKSCSKIVSLWQRVRQTAETETNYRPPGDAVRIAKASLAGSNSTAEQKRPDSLAELLFDGFWPVPEGVRSSSIRTRHMFYRADPFQIDLLIESQADGRSVVVTGQLLDLRHPEIVGHNLQVTFSNLRGRVVQATTNQFGEFCQEIENSGNLELKFYGANHKPVVISLRDDLRA